MIKLIILLLCFLVIQPALAASVTIQCRGEGPGLDAARQDADRACINSVVTQLDSDIDVKGVSIETAHDTAYHSEVTRTGSYNGLKCTPSGEKITTTGDQTLVEYTCQYDLLKVKRMSKPYDRIPATYNPGKRVVSLATVPYCYDLLIRGQTPRVVQCLSNPVRLVLKDTDESVTVRAPGHLPKTVQKGDLDDSATVVLDPVR